MEGQKIYEESLIECRKIQRSLASGSINIDVNKLDSNTRGEIVQALGKVLSKRVLDIQKVLTGVK